MSRSYALKVRFDPKILRVVLAHVAQTTRDEALQRALIGEDASRAMMRSLFGMGSREYTRLRSQLAVESGVGRPVALDEADEHRLWHALAGRLRQDPERPLEPEAVLEVHDETGLTVRAIWSHAQRWAAEEHGLPG